MANGNGMFMDWLPAIAILLGAVYLGTRNGNNDDDNDNGDNGNGGGGGDNQSPTVMITFFSESNGFLDVEADGSDPDGQIVAYDWELFRDGTRVSTATGKTATLEMAGSGDYELVVHVHDDDGATAQDAETFPFQA